MGKGKAATGQKFLRINENENWSDREKARLKIILMVYMFYCMSIMSQAHQQIEWTCNLMTWHGLYQHPHAKDKDKWYVHPEHAIADADDYAINEWAIFGSAPFYSASIIKKIMEDTQDLAIEERITEIRCNYECSNYYNPEDGETCLMWLGAENGPVIEGFGGVNVEYVGTFNAKKREYVWHPRTAIDEALVKGYFHHIPTQEELNIMCYEGGLFRLDDLFKEPEKKEEKDETNPENIIYLGSSANAALKRNLSEL